MPFTPPPTGGVNIPSGVSPGYSQGSAFQMGTPVYDAATQLWYAPVVVSNYAQTTTPGDTALRMKAANTPPTLADPSLITILSPNNSGLPVNLSNVLQKAGAVSTGSVASLAKAFTNANVAGNTIVVVCGVGNGTTPTVADTLGNTYTQAAISKNSTTFEAAIFFATGILSGANTVTVTNAGAAASMALEIYEVPGLLALANAQPDTTMTATGTSATPTGTQITPSVPNGLAFMGVAVGTAAQAVSVTSGTGWTLDSTQNSGGTPAGLFTFGALSQSLPTINPIVPQATIAGSEPFALAAAVFKPVALPIQGTVTAIPALKPTYTYAISATAPYATPTDYIVIRGSATKTVKITHVEISGAATAATEILATLKKHTIANTAGTATNPTPTQHDSNDAAASALVLLYSVAPTIDASATIWKNVRFTLALAPAATANIPDRYVWDAGAVAAEPLVLRGVAQEFALNLGGGALAGGEVLDVAITWTEDNS